MIIKYSARKSSEFELIGHINGLGLYPSIVLPVGILDEENQVSAYVQGGGRVLVSDLEVWDFVPDGLLRVLYNKETLSRLGNFDFSKHSLWAYDSDDLVSFDWDDKKAFYESVIRSGRVDDKPFVAVRLARGLQNEELLYDAFVKSLSVFKKYDRKFAQIYVNDMIRDLRNPFDGPRMAALAKRLESDDFSKEHIEPLFS